MTRIGFFGLRNTGKSSLVNKITNQDMSVVSDVKGTTTDPVKKTMEILPLGPVTIIDTPGFDDEGELGEKRIQQTKKILRNCDIAILVTVAGAKLTGKEEELISIFQERKIPYIIVKNKVDLLEVKENLSQDKLRKCVLDDDAKRNNIEVYASTKNFLGIEELKNIIGRLSQKEEKQIHFVSDFINEKDIVVLVTPIDESAPKGRLILPQQMAVRDILDEHGIPIVTQLEELEQILTTLKEKPKLVITDSQVFQKVKEIVPEEINLTSFSILMARYKGFLDTAVKGVRKIDELKDGSKILISEGCTHHRQCEDIGTVKIPTWLKAYTKKELNFEWTNGMGFPDNLTKYDLIIHCGGCMLNENEMKYRMEETIHQNVSFTNYGIMISYMQGILERSIKMISNI